MSRVHTGSHASGSLHQGRRQAFDPRRLHQGQARRPPQTRSARPVPKFDMNLADLFNDNSPLTDRSRAENLAGHPYPVRPEHGESMVPGLAAEGPSRPFVQRTPSMEYYLKYEAPGSPQPPQQFYYSTSPQHTGSPGSVAPNAANGPHAVPPTDPDAQTGISLDFLDFRSGDPDGQALETDPNGDYSMANMPPLGPLGPNLGQNVGIDLGFGMAMDFQHDWSENPNYDLLEGYFFGGSGPGASGGDV